MNECIRVKDLLPLLTGGELDRKGASRVTAHLDGCQSCRGAEADFRRLKEMARRVERPYGLALPEGVRRQIALQAARSHAVQGSLISRSRSFILRTALAAVDSPIRPAQTALALASVLVVLLALPHAFNQHGPSRVTERVTRIDVVAQGGQVRLAWADGHKEAYTVVESPDPRTFSPREAYRVDGNVWVDSRPDSWPVVFYRIE